MKRFKKELSVLLVIALSISSISLGLGQLQASAQTQAVGQMGSYRYRVKTAGQDCNGTGTVNSLFITINYSDGTSATSDTIAGEASPNYFEAGNTDTISLNPALPAKPISSITFTSNGSDRWKVDWTALDYYDGVDWRQIATTGGFDIGGGVRAMTYPSTYSLNTSSLNKTLTFNAAGGTGGKQIYSIQGATLPESNTPTVTKTGYTFAGWSPAVPSNGPSADTTHYAQWTPTNRNITFDANGGIGGTGPTALLVGSMLVPPTVNKAGYTFITWSPSVPATVPAIDQTYTAVWLADGEMDYNIYNIVFNSNGGSGSMPMQYISFGQTDALASNTFTKSGYSFLGWATSPVTAALGVAEYTDGENYTITANDVTLYAAWKINSYTITFDANGGNGGSSNQLVYGTSLIAPTVTRTGHTFASWTPAVPSTTPDSDTTYTAQWTPVSYTVAYNANGGSGTTSSSSHTYDEARMLNWNNFTRTGYTFTGWATSTSGSVVYLNGQSVSNLSSANGSTFTLFAKWTANSYTIIFDANGGTGGTTSTRTFGTSFTAPTVTRSGFTFKSWSPAKPSTVPAADVTYTAQWTEDTIWTITFDANGGSDGSSTVMESGSVLTAPTVAREGYTFVGWTPTVPSTSPAADVTYTAQWGQNTVTISFDANGGIDGSSGIRVPGEALTATPVTRTGYSLTGWLPALPSTVPEANTTYVAQWTVNKYTVSFNSAGGSLMESITQDYGTDIAAPPDPVKEAYTFAGWLPAVPSTMPAEDLLCTAQWAVNKYTVSFDSTGGSPVADITQDFGTAITSPADPVKEGYTFDGWTPAMPAVMPAENTACAAQWTVNQYTVSFVSAGGSLMESITQDYGTDIAAPPDPVKEGCTFAGWLPAIPAAMPAEDTICIAQWTVNKYTVSFDSTGGSPVADITQDFGSAITSPADPVKEGYTFTGWLPVIPGTMPAENVECLAQWTLNSYSITFDANGGVSSAGQTVNFGEMPIAPFVTRANYRFVGWSPELVAATGNAVYTAQWIMLGDISANGTISSLDALMLLQHVAGLNTLSETQLLQADVDMNGVVNNIDALKILQFASEIILVFT
jgi:uncharacterized repeat protein (TIGR02543 family)